GSQFLERDDASGQTAVDTYPPDEAPLGEATTITPGAFSSGSMLALGATGTFRIAARSLDGSVYLGTPVPLVFRAAALTPLVDPISIALGGSGSFTFLDSGWPSYEAQVDTDPAQGIESFAPNLAVVTPGLVTYSPPLAGHYRFRVRGHVDGCA